MSTTQREKTVKTAFGIVVSNKMDKSAVVKVERKVKHPLYGKYIKRSKKFTVHDEANACREGDMVKIREARPFSKRKRWEFVEVVKAAVE